MTTTGSDMDPQPRGSSLPPLRRRYVALAVIVAALAGGTLAVVTPPRHRSVVLPGHGLLDVLAPDLAPVGGGTQLSRRSPALPISLPLARAAAQLFLVGTSGTDTHAPVFGSLRARDWGGVVLTASN